MQVLVNSDKNVSVDAAMVDRVKEELVSSLARFSGEITRVEVHFGDETAGRSDGRDKRCMLEARPAGHPPVTVTDWAGTAEAALNGAVDKLLSLLDSTWGRRDDSHQGGRSIRHLDVREGLV